MPFVTSLTTYASDAVYRQYITKYLTPGSTAHLVPVYIYTNRRYYVPVPPPHTQHDFLLARLFSARRCITMALTHIPAVVGISYAIHPMPHPRISAFLRLRTYASPHLRSLSGGCSAWFSGEHLSSRPPDVPFGNESIMPVVLWCCLPWSIGCRSTRHRVPSANVGRYPKGRYKSRYYLFPSVKPSTMPFLRACFPPGIQLPSPIPNTNIKYPHPYPGGACNIASHPLPVPVQV